MEECQVLAHSEEFIVDVESCINQFIFKTIISNDCAVITVWESSMANKHLRNNAPTPKGDFAVICKKIAHYSNHGNIRRINDIWNKGLFPIEIITEDGGVFYSVPKDAIFNKTFSKYNIKMSEEEIPDVNDFEVIEY